MRKFKKRLSLLLAATMAFSVFSALPFMASAAEVDGKAEAGAEKQIAVVSATQDEVTGYYYEVLDDGTAEITDYIGADNELVIPNEINGYKVTSIGKRAFSDCSTLTGVIIPDGVTSIERGAFIDCDNLEGIEIPASVTSIEEMALGYYFDNSSWNEFDWGYFPEWGFTIYGYAGTAAEDYAKANDFDFAKPCGFIPHYAIVGDSNGDGVIDITDATLIQKYSVGIDTPHTGKRFAYTDVNLDGRISILDVTCVQKYLAGGYKNTGCVGQTGLG